MFEFDVNQAAGLSVPASISAPVVMPVATTARPGQAYELICTIASQLNAMGHDAVIIDGTATETGEHNVRDGGHLGLAHALFDTSIAGLGAPRPGNEWLVMPGARGLQVLQQTAQAAGSMVAMSRLLAPFASGTVVLLYAPAATLGALFSGQQAVTIVPVLGAAQATLDAYGSLKVLHAAGLSPVLAPIGSDTEATSAQLGQVVRNVCDCAQRHLGYPVGQWALETLGQQVRACGLTAPWQTGASPSLQAGALNNFAGHAAANPSRWS
jgi:hypothetical protein